MFEEESETEGVSYIGTRPWVREEVGGGHQSMVVIRKKREELA
jgi:hypothetical protein